MDILTWDVFDIWISNIIRDISTEKLKKKKEHIFSDLLYGNFPFMWCWLLLPFYVIFVVILKDKTRCRLWMAKEASEIKSKPGNQRRLLWVFCEAKIIF